MVVVAIIGIISTVAIPQFSKYKARSRSIEARLILGELHSVMNAYFASYETYSTCYHEMGMRVLTENYFTYGPAPADYDPLNTLSDNAASSGTQCVDGANAIADSLPSTKTFNTLQTNPGELTLGNITQTTFLIEALGHISNISTDGTDCDQWTIDQDKNVAHPRAGY
jgi:type IV pilus assembly protein PilA